MKTNANCSKAIFFVLVLLLSYTTANSQKLSSLAPADNPVLIENIEPAIRLQIVIETWHCVNGGTQAMVSHPMINDNEYFNRRQFVVSWYDSTGKLVSNNNVTPGCFCGKLLYVVVQDNITGEVAGGAVNLSRCERDDMPSLSVSDEIY